MPTSRSYHEYLIESLKDPQEAAAYLNAVLQDGSSDEIRLALNNIAEAQGERWELLSCYGADRARSIAQERGCNWDTMTEEEREAFIDGLCMKASVNCERCILLRL